MAPNLSWTGPAVSNKGWRRDNKLADQHARRALDASRIFKKDLTFVWSGGDSLVGKQAVKDYYLGRWKLLESVSFSNDIFLPVQVNVSPNGAAPAGKWMLHWVQVDAKYKNGKAITFWLHNASHYGENGKVDYVAQYIDRLPLMEATKGMMK